MPLLHRAWSIGHLWSLSVEEHFYLLWPFVFRRLRPRLAMQALFAYVAITPALRYVIWSRHLLWLDIDFCSVSQMSSIATGCILAFVCKGYGLPLLEKSFAKRPALVLLLGIGVVTLDDIAQRSGKFAILVGDPLTAVGAALVIAGAVYSGRSLASRILNTRVVVAIGVLSYSLYLWQQPFTSPQALASGWPTNVALMVLGATASYYCVESPFLRLKARRSRSIKSDITAVGG